jgi:xanthine dehydrogenase small subunit
MASAGTGFEFLLNGRTVQVGAVGPQTTLLDYVRSRGLTGAKEGCAEGECGACAVLLVENSTCGTVYRSVNSCLVPLPAVAGQEICTVEALAESGQLAEVQRAMAAGGGSQCGYCTPGFVVSMFAEQHRRDDHPADFHELGGNLCRCTGYRPIKDALLSLGAPHEGNLKARLGHPARELQPLHHETSDGWFVRPCNLAECVELGAGEGTRFIAGNTDLGVLTNLRGERFRRLISLEGVAELREFRDAPEGVEIGAGLTLTEIAERWDTAPAVFGEWIKLFASPLIRNRATLGGNLATASPIGDSAPLLLALDAEVRIVGSRGERTLPLARFFQGYRKTSLGPGEILRSVRIPKPLPTETRFYKVAKRSMDDISTVAAGIAMRPDRVTLGLGGVAAVPLQINAHTFEDAENAAAAVKPLSDHRGSAEYRLAMVGSLIRKFKHETGL